MAEQDQFRESISDEVALTLGDRINFPYILANQIITFQKAIVKEEGLQSAQEIMEAAQGLYELIPDVWRVDDKASFEKEVEAANVLITVDQRKHWCGVPIGEPNPVTFKMVNPYKLFHACMNLLQRRGLLARTLYTEIKTGKEYLEQAIEDAEKEAQEKKETGETTS